MSEGDTKSKLYFYCEMCGKKVSSAKSLANHKRHVHNPVPTTCPACGVIFPNRHKGRDSIHLKNITKILAKILTKTITNFLSKNCNKQEGNGPLDLRAIGPMNHFRNVIRRRSTEQ